MRFQIGWDFFRTLVRPIRGLTVYTYVNKIFPECLCNEDGSTSISCDDISGNCVCRPNVVGSKCDQCDDSHYDFPDCPGIMIINNI